MYTNLELFAGAGGMALGLKKAGFHSVGMIEWDKWAVNTLRTNLPDDNIIHGDIVELANEGIRPLLDASVNEIDLISGGCPCQSFSVNGKKLGIKDPRGQLFISYVKILNEFKPRCFLFENVKGLLMQKHKQDLHTIYTAFQSAGYTLISQVLNAKYYDVPQARERFFIVGIRNDIFKSSNEKSIYFEFPKHNEICTLEKSKVFDNFIESPLLYLHKSYYDILYLIPEGFNWSYISKHIREKTVEKINCTNYYNALYKVNRKDNIIRLAREGVAPTTVCQPKGFHHNIIHPTENRPLTIREFARIQTFSDDYIFDCPKTNQVKQIGNAVPVNLAYHIGKSILQFLRTFDSSV